VANADGTNTTSEETATVANADGTNTTSEETATVANADDTNTTSEETATVADTDGTNTTSEETATVANADGTNTTSEETATVANADDTNTTSEETVAVADTDGTNATTTPKSKAAKKSKDTSKDISYYEGEDTNVQKYKVIEHIHDESCIKTEEVNYTIVQPEYVINDEITTLLNTYVSGLGNGNYDSIGSIIGYLEKLATLDTSDTIKNQKVNGYWVEEQDLESYMTEIASKINSYKNKVLIDNVINSEEFYEIISNLIDDDNLEEAKLKKYAQKIIGDESVDLLLFKFVLLYYVDNSNSGIATASVDDETEEKNTEYYVGIKGKSKYDFAASGGGAEVSNLYVMKESDYDEMFSKEFDTKNYDDAYTSRKALATVAYCFNHGRNGIPGNGFYAGYNYNWGDKTRCLYTLIENVTGAQFAKYADFELINDTNELRRWIISVVLNGYPTNYSGFQGNLSDSAFRFVTQYALWYYTDSFKLDVTLTSEEQEVYDKLITTKLPLSVTDNVGTEVNVYEFSSCTIESPSGYQNLLTVKKGAELPEEPSNNVSLTLSKTLTGGTSDSIFNFTVTMKDRDGKPIVGDKSVVVFNIGADSSTGESTTVKFDGNGVANIELNSGKSIKISGLPYGYSYTIQEVNATRYKAKISLESGNDNDKDKEVTIDNDNKTISKMFVTEDTAIKYENEKLTDDNLSLKITKKVIGNTSDNKSFHFKITVKDKDNNPIVGAYQYQGATYDNNGSYDFYLGNNDCITFSGLPYQFSYTIEEYADSDYSTEIKLERGETADSIGKNTNGNMAISKAAVTDDAEIVYQNTKLENLVIRKEVSSDVSEDATKGYEFKIKITKDGKLIDEKNITITGGEESEIRNIPYGCKVEVSELNAEKFNTKITTTMGGQSTSYESQKSIAVDMTNNVTILFENSFVTPKVVVPTGIRIDVLPYLVIMVIALGGLIGFVVRRRISKGR
jgi:TQXA domain-containing protein